KHGNADRGSELTAYEIRESAVGGFECVPESVGLIRRHLDHETATTLQGDAHHDAPTLLRHLEGTVSGPGLHGRHSVLPPSLPPTLSGVPRPEPRSFSPIRSRR